MLARQDLGQTNPTSRTLYGLVGLAAVYGIAQLTSRNTSIGGTHSASTQA